jgi:hypothetical protein
MQDLFVYLYHQLKSLKSDKMVRSFDNSIVTRYKRITIFILCFLFATLSIISGQKRKEQPPPLRERMFFGGSLGLQFGTYTDIQVTPIVGLWVKPRIAIAAGPNFRYYKDPYYETTMYGGNAYVQFVPLQDINNILPIGIHMGIFLHLEDELLNLDDPYIDNTRVTVNTVLAGFGIRQQLGARSALNLTFLWALNDSVYNLYSNPEIRISFNF